MGCCDVVVGVLGCRVVRSANAATRHRTIHRTIHRTTKVPKVPKKKVATMMETETENCKAQSRKATKRSQRRYDQ